MLEGVAARPRAAAASIGAALGARRRLRIGLVCALIALPLLGGGWMWLRHSSFVAVEHVRISGARGASAGAIDQALAEAARRQSTLDAQPAALRAAVARFPEVAAIHVSTSFPHAMRIAVVERTAVAALLVGGSRIAVGTDGVALGPSAPAASLPTVADDVAPASGDRARNPLVLEALAVLGAAPAGIGKLASRAYFSPRGLTVAMRNGLLVYFGDATRPHAKWLALAGVLADPSSAGAVYVDVRSPERAAAGFAPGTGPHEAEGSEGAGETQIGRGETTVSALAAGLAAATPEGRAHSGAGATEEAPEEGSKETAPGSSTGATNEEAGGEEAGREGTQPGG